MGVVVVLAVAVGICIAAMFALIVFEAVLEFLRKSRRFVRSKLLSGDSPENPLTPLLIWGGLALTTIGVVGGLWQNVAPFWQNVLANLVLVGPAVVLSDFVVADVLRKRSDKRAVMQLGMLGLLLAECFQVANTYLLTLESDRRCINPDAWTQDGDINLRGLLASIDEAQQTVVQAEKEVYESTTDDDRQYSVPFRSEKSDFQVLPNFAAVRTTVAALNHEFSCPWALLAATAAEDFSRNCYVDFVWEGRGSIFRAPGEGPPRIADPKIGFGEISVWMERARVNSSSSKMTIELASYNHFVQGCLHRARTVLDQVIACCPERLMPKEGN